MESTLALLIPLAGIAMVFGIVYLGVTSDNRKNLAMIEAGMNPNDKKYDKRKNLRTALLFIFVPIGFFLGSYIKKIGDFSGPVSIITAFLFGGIALLIYHYASKREEDKDLID